MKDPCARKARYGPGRRGGGVNPSTKPHAGFLPAVGYIERGLDDTTQRTLGVRAERRATLVSEGTLPTRPMPSPILVTWLSTLPCEVATSFHRIAEVGCREGLYFR